MRESIMIVVFIAAGIFSFFELIFRRFGILAKLGSIIGNFIAGQNTMVHECSHAITSLITGGKIVSINVFKNTEGLAETLARGWFSRFCTSLTGYIGPVVGAYFGFYFLAKGEAKRVLLAFLIISCFALLVWLRDFFATVLEIRYEDRMRRRSLNLIARFFVWFFGAIASVFTGRLWRNIKGKNYYGFFLFASYIVIDGLVYISKNQRIIGYYVFFLLSILLIQSIYTAWEILYLSAKRRKNAGDASNLAKQTFVPTLVWGMLFFAQSVYGGYYTIQIVWRMLTHAH